MFCSGPIPDADNHLSIVATADRPAILRAVDAALLNLAKMHRARFLVMKEFEQDEAIDASRTTRTVACSRNKRGRH